MKKSFLFFLSANCILVTLNAQQAKLPPQVVNSFRTRYPHAENILLRNKQSCYRAEFALNGNKMIADFTSTGELISTERTMRFEELPAEVKAQFKKSKYAGWQKEIINESQIYGEPLQYSIVVKKGSNIKKTLIFDVNGRSLGQENP